MPNVWRSLPASGGESAGALADIRILDLSGVGAYVSMLLSDFGADVIRVAAATGALGKPKMTTGSRFDPAGAADPARSAAFNGSARIWRRRHLETAPAGRH
jgi:crotonobetainyl-CoA:carnitine CoA-transferase CaiB-like acyl-CoA transferase